MPGLMHLALAASGLAPCSLQRKEKDAALYSSLIDGMEGPAWSCAMMDALLLYLTAAKNSLVVQTGSCGFLRVNRRGRATRRWGGSVG